MKKFRGTLVVLALLIGALLFVVLIEKPVEDDPNAAQEIALFDFEKQDLVRARVSRPCTAEELAQLECEGLDVVTLLETDEGWIIEETGFRASKSMVNRFKHQLHDLVARATVVADADDPALYGLGSEQRAEVELRFRDGSEQGFYGGDPNPSGVSYYLQPNPGDAVYTVKKSAVDFLFQDFSKFREARFAGFNSKDVDRLKAELPDGRVLELQRVGESRWVMLQPLQMNVSTDKARSLLGRVAVLKADRFVEDLGASGGDLSPYGLDEPRARITVSFGTRAPLTLLVGDTVPDGADPAMAWMMVSTDRTVYTAKEAFLEDYLVDPAELRDFTLVELDDEDIVEIEVEMLRHPDEPELNDVVPLSKPGDRWMWFDGTPVPGSTPKRVASRVASLKADEFVDGPLSRFGLDQPMARVRVSDDQGVSATLLLGDQAPSGLGIEDREIRRVYAVVEGSEQVVIVDWSVVSVLEDAVREQRRKKKNEAEKAERRELIDEGGE
jgi:hypothetical protein